MDSDFPLSQMTRAIVGAAQPEQVILFGSRASGSFHPQSDFDLAVVFQSATDVRSGLRRANRALWPREHPVDLVALTLDSIKQGRTVLAREVKSSGKILYDRALEGAPKSHEG